MKAHTLSFTILIICFFCNQKAESRFLLMKLKASNSAFSMNILKYNRKLSQIMAYRQNDIHILFFCKYFGIYNMRFILECQGSNDNKQI